jgi:predicted porin
MKLKATAAAVLALSSGMGWAQTAPATEASQPTVTVYGNLDIGVSSSSTSATGYAPNGTATADKGAVTKLQDGGIGGSNWGIKGSRSLPNGMTAGFQLQGNINVGNGALNATSGAYPGPTSALFNQIAKINLGGKWGEIGVGRQISPLYYAMAYTDGREGRFTGSILSAIVGANSSAGWNGTTTNAPLGAIYDDNTVVYTTPKMNGVTGNLQYTAGGVNGNAQAGNRGAATLQYANSSGLKLSAAYYVANDAYTAATSANGTLNNRVWHVGAKYDLQDWTLSASLNNMQNPSGVNSGGTSPATTAAGNANYNISHLGLGYKISPMYRITSGYYKLQDMNVSDNNATLVAAGLDIYLDRQTMLYVQAGQVANNGNTNMGIIYGAPVAAGVTTVAYMAGVRYSF